MQLLNNQNQTGLLSQDVCPALDLQPGSTGPPAQLAPPIFHPAQHIASPPVKPPGSKDPTKGASQSYSNKNKRAISYMVYQEKAKLSHIIKSRRELVQQLARLQYEESQAKQNQKKSSGQPTRSHLTQDQIERIHQALQARKQFEQASRRKITDLQNKIRAQTIQEQKEQVQRIQHQRTAHKLQALQRLESLQRRQQQRQEDISKTKQKLQLLQNKQYLHQAIDKKWENIKQQQKIEDQSRLKQIHSRRCLSIDDITKHQQLYLSRRQKEIEQRQKRLEADRLIKSRIQQATLTQFQPSKFLLTIFEEQHNKQRQLEAKRKQYRTYTLKKTEYSHSIKELNHNRWIKDRLQPIQQSSQPSPERSAARKRHSSLSQVELLKLGNSYMRQVHSSIGHVEQEAEVQKNVGREQQRPEDYLARMRKQRQEKKKGEPGSPEAREVREFKSVLKRTGPFEDKLYMIKLLTSKMEERVGRDSRMMVASINAKLQMISHLVEA